MPVPLATAFFIFAALMIAASAPLGGVILGAIGLGIQLAAFVLAGTAPAAEGERRIAMNREFAPEEPDA